MAVDKASFDLSAEHYGKNIFNEFWPELNPIRQIEHAAEIGLGSLEYEIVEVA